MQWVEYCYNDNCNESISVLFEDQDCPGIDWTYHNRKTNIKYKSRFGRYFCDKCMDNIIAISLNLLPHIFIGMVSRLNELLNAF